MTRVVLIGYAPDAIDFSDPALPPGLDADRIRADLARGLEGMRQRGWEVEFCPIRPDGTAGPTVERHLASGAYDCAVIGAGVRVPPRSLETFEAVLNAVRRAAPGAAIALNTRPDDSADAAARQLTGP